MCPLKRQIDRTLFGVLALSVSSGIWITRGGYGSHLKYTKKSRLSVQWSMNNSSGCRAGRKTIQYYRDIANKQENPEQTYGIASVPLLTLWLLSQVLTTFLTTREPCETMIESMSTISKSLLEVVAWDSSQCGHITVPAVDRVVLLISTRWPNLGQGCENVFIYVENYRYNYL